MQNDDYVVLGAMLIITIIIAINEYKRTRDLWQILEKINYANKQYFLDVVIKKNDNWKYKRIKVSKKAFDNYKVNDWIAI